MLTKHEVYHQEGHAPCPQAEVQPNNAIPAPVAAAVVCPTMDQFPVKEKSVVEAYLLWLSFGFLGFHHFYLNRPGFGTLYFFTLGLSGVGYLIDLFRIPHLVKEENRRLRNPEPEISQKNLSDAYTLWFPFGLLGFHHFYLGNLGAGTLYFFTLGLCGIGWFIDLFRMPSMVRKANSLQPSQKLEKSLLTAYVLGVSPFGFFGFHHFYLNRPFFGLFYVVTLGNFGLGYLFDLFRMPILVKRANINILEGQTLEKHLDDAYLFWFPYGIVGCHHFYLGRPIWGMIYFFTWGLLGIGWLVDGMRMPCLVKEYNRTVHQRSHRTPLISSPRPGVVIAAPPQTNWEPTSQVSSQSVGEYQQPGYGTQPFYQQQPILNVQQSELGNQRPSPSAPSYDDDPPPYSSISGTSDDPSGYQKM